MARDYLVTIGGGVPASGESARVLALLAEGPGPATPPVNYSGDGSGNGPDAALLVSPHTTAPPGSVTVTAGVDDINNIHFAHGPGTTFWLSPGVHTPGLGSPTPFGQVQTKTGYTYIGAPGAILDGAGVCRTAFTQASNVAADNVTVKYLEIRNFVVLTEQYVNDNQLSSGWVLEYCNVHDNNNGWNMGDGGRVSYSWLHDNGQYGNATYAPPVDNGLTGAVQNVELEYCEVDHNGTWQDEFPTGSTGPLGSGLPNGNGRNGGMKFWDTDGALIHHCYVHDNEHTGIWADTNNIDFTIEDSYVADNYGVGIFYEISYNIGCRRNTLLRNGIFLGANFASVFNPAHSGYSSFPVGAFYFSEVGGDATVNVNWATSYIGGEDEADGNTLIDNWDNVVLWESTDRFCNSPSNTSHKIWKPRATIGGQAASLAVCNIPAAKTMVLACTNGSPNFTWVSGDAFEAFSTLQRSSDEGRPVSGTGIPGGTRIWEPAGTVLDGDVSRGLIASPAVAGSVPTTGRFTANFTGTTGNVTVTLAAGTINAENAYTACRWNTKNIVVKNNLVAYDEATVLAVYPVNYHGIKGGRSAVMAQPGTGTGYLSWSPYSSSGPFGANEIQQRVTFENGNVFAANDYRGVTGFLPYEMVLKTFGQWQAAPYNQDAGSTNG